MKVFFLIVIFIKIMKRLLISLNQSSELTFYPDQPVYQIASLDKKYIYVFAGIKSFTITSQSTLYERNIFDENKSLTLDKSMVIKRVSNDKIAIACGKKAIVFLSETAAISSVYSFEYYDHDIQCSFIQIDNSMFCFAYVFQGVYHIDLLTYEASNSSMLQRIKEFAINSPFSATLIACELFESNQIIFCIYYTSIIQGCYLDKQLGIIEHFDIFNQNSPSQVIKVDNQLIDLFVINDNDILVFIFKYIPEDNKVILVTQKSIFPISFASLAQKSFDIKCISSVDTHGISTHYFVIIVCQSFICYLGKFDSGFENSGSMVTFRSGLSESLVGVSLGFFNENDITIIFSQKLSNYLIQYSFPACFIKNEIMHPSSSFYFSTINNIPLVEITIIQADNLNIYTLNSNPNIIVDLNTKYLVNDLVFTSLTQGTFKLLYQLIYDSDRITTNCQLIFNICYYKCATCFEFGTELNNMCITCAIGYIPSKNNNYQCVIDENGILIKQCSSQLKFWLEAERSCVSSCLPYNLYNSILKSMCVSICDSNEILNNIQKECLSNYLFNIKMGHYINHLDKYILDLYMYHPLHITDSYGMRIYNTSTLPKDYSVETVRNGSVYDTISLSRVYPQNCENILKKKYNINPQEPLIIAKFDMFLVKQISNVVQYSIYSINGIKLDLSHCNKEEIVIVSPISDVNNYNVSLAKNFSYSTINIFNPEDLFFTDICYPYADVNNTDIPLINRLKDFFLDQSDLCNPDCKYSQIDFEKHIIICSCSTNITHNFKEIYSILQTHLSSFLIKTHLEIIKCYYMIFNKHLFSNNLGSWFILFFIVFETIVTIYFSIFGHQLFEINLIDLFNSKTEKKKEIRMYNSKRVITSVSNYQNSINSHARIKHNILILKKGRFSVDSPQNKKIITSHRKEFTYKNPNPRKYSGNESNMKTNNFPESSIEYEKMIKGFNNNNNDINININKQKKKNSKVFDGTINLKIIPFKNQSQNFKQNMKEQVENEDQCKSKEPIPDKSFLQIDNSKKPGNIDNQPINPWDNIYSLNEIKELLQKEKIQNRSKIWACYRACLQISHPVIRSFCRKKDKKAARLIHLSMFFFCIALSLFLNAVFFTMANISQIYEDNGIVDYNFILPKILYSFLVGLIFKFFLNWLSSFESLVSLLKFNIEENDNFEHKIIVINWFKCRLSVFYALLLIFLAFFWYYVSAFCAIYSNTQLKWIINTVICFLIEMIFPLVLSVIVSIVLLLSIKYNWTLKVKILTFIMMLS